MSGRSTEDEDLYSSYSDDFESSPTLAKKSSKYSLGNKRKVSNHQTSEDSEDESSSTLRSSPIQVIKKEVRKKSYKRSVAQKTSSKRSTQISSKRTSTVFKSDSVQNRILSAQRHRINVLTNELGEARIKLDELSKENRTLKTLQHRQEKSLKKFEDIEGDLPRMISQHMEDQRVLKARLRKSQEAERLTEGKLKESNDEIKRMQTSLDRLKKIVYEKNLGERSELAKQLAVAEDKFYSEEKRRKELQKKLQLTTQSYSRQLRNEQIKHKETINEFQLLKKKCNFLEDKVKEKERALEVSNIYSHRKKAGISEKSNLSSKLSITAPVDDKMSPSLRSRPPLPIKMEEPQNLIRSDNDLEAIPALNAFAATTASIDHRKTFKSPVKPPSAKVKKIHDSEIKEDKTDRTSSILSELTLNQSKSPNQSEIEQVPPVETLPRRSIFLTADESRSSTFLSERPLSPVIAPPASKRRSPSPARRKEVEIPFSEVKDEKQLEEERKKLEEERRKKADLLAKMKDLEAEDKLPNSYASRKSEAQDILSILSKDTKSLSRSFIKSEKNPKSNAIQEFEELSMQLAKYERRSSRQSTCKSAKVENLHKGIPSISNMSTSQANDEPELTFGSYAPSVALPAKRKPTQLVQKTRQKPSSSSESDEPLLDLTSGKTKKNDFLEQLFGSDSSQRISNGPIKTETSFLSVQSSSSNITKTSPRAKPIHSGYPWEKNIMTASQMSHIGNGDAHSTPKHKDIKASSAIKSPHSFVDDEIEELIL